MEVIIEDETQQLIRLVVGYGIWDSLTHVGIARMQNTRGTFGSFPATYLLHSNPPSGVVSWQDPVQYEYYAT
jgi:hypothetical protein